MMYMELFCCLTGGTHRALARSVIHDVTDGRLQYGGRPSMTSSRDVTASPL
jgi:hypothetical protein